MSNTIYDEFGRKVNYRKICQEHYGYTNEEMSGMDVHHIDQNRQNNCPTNLQLLTPEDHAAIHADQFVLWARKGAKLGNEAFRKRLKEDGFTGKEEAYNARKRELFKTNPLRKPTPVVGDGIEYPGVVAAADAVGVSRRTIRNWIIDKRKEWDYLANNNA